MESAPVQGGWQLKLAECGWLVGLAADADAGLDARQRSAEATHRGDGSRFATSFRHRSRQVFRPSARSPLCYHRHLFSLI